jgi:hypothetical protein
MDKENIQEDYSNKRMHYESHQAFQKRIGKQTYSFEEFYKNIEKLAKGKGEIYWSAMVKIDSISNLVQFGVFINSNWIYAHYPEQLFRIIQKEGENPSVTIEADKTQHSMNYLNSKTQEIISNEEFEKLDEKEQSDYLPTSAPVRESLSPAPGLQEVKKEEEED